MIRQVMSTNAYREVEPEVIQRNDEIRVGDVFQFGSEDTFIEVADPDYTSVLPDGTRLPGRVRYRYLRANGLTITSGFTGWTTPIDTFFANFRRANGAKV